MVAAARVGARTLGDAWGAIVPLAVLNFLWLALSLTVVLLPPATAAMFVATHELARGRQVSVREYVGEVRRTFRQAWAWGVLNVVVVGLVAVNLVFYDRPEPWAMLIRSLFLLAGLGWIMAQLLVWPYLQEQEDRSLLLAVRNALLTVLAAPVFSLVLAGIVAIVVALSLALVVPLATLTTALLCLLGNHAVLDRLVAFGKVRPAVNYEEASNV